MPANSHHITNTTAHQHVLDDDDSQEEYETMTEPTEEGRMERRHSAPMTVEEQNERRASIREIMGDNSLTPFERRRTIQSLMDGRRRSSGGAQTAGESMSMMAAAAAAAAEFYDSSDDDDDDEQVQELPSDQASHGDSSIGVASTHSAPGATFPSYPRATRSASLNSFAASAAAAAAAQAALEVADDEQDIVATCQRMEQSRPACQHYQRNCTIISPCCGLAFGCRICHDECPVLPPEKQFAETTVDPSRRRRSLPTNISAEEAPTHHTIDRFAIAEVICRKCFTRQSSKTNQCKSCKIRFGEYHCSVCNLWMSAEEDPYHCFDCGFCRVGGADNFSHCNDCGMCIDVTLLKTHNCKAGKYLSNCPVCQEDLFSSRSASHEMPCGHAIHWHCFQEWTRHSTKCPICQKTAYEEMESTWSDLAASIALQPVPPEMARLVTILCNDCESRQENRQWHFLGVQCQNCQSFNTTVEQITLTGPEAAEAAAAQANHNGEIDVSMNGSNVASLPTDNVNDVVMNGSASYPQSYQDNDVPMNGTASHPDSMDEDDTNL